MYDVIAAPPLDAGAVNATATTTDDPWRVATIFVGDPGTDDGAAVVIELDGLENALLPIAFVA